MMKKMILLLSLFLLLTGNSAGAADLKALLGEAGEQADAGQVQEAAATLRQAMAEVWAIKPISIKKAVLVGKKAPNFGQFAPRKNNVFRPGEPIYVYAEPIGYRFDRQGEIYTFGFSADFNVLNEGGEVLGGQRGFGKWKFSSREPLFEVYVNLTYNLTGAPAGKYVFETTFNDMNGGGQVTFKTPVVIK